MKEKTRDLLIAGGIALMLLAVLLLTGGGNLVLGEKPYATAPADPDAPFSCFAYDRQGHRLEGFRSEKDGVWYLFLPSVQPAAEVELRFTGKVCTSSAGELNPEMGTLTGAFRANADRVTLTLEDGTEQTVIVMQSNLPSVYVELEGTTLAQIHANKDQRHGGSSVSIMDPGGNWNLTVEASVEIKGRGNSSWREYPKKGYQLTFYKETSVMGMGSAKKWVLLAGASDDSMMRTQLVSQMAQEFDMAFAPSFAYVDLWIGGEYLGTYLLGEKVEPGPARLQFSDAAGALFEHDEAFYADEEHWFLSKYLNRHFTLKEIVAEDTPLVQSAMADFEAAVDELTHYLYTTLSADVTLEKLSEMIDVDSFAKYFLINEYALNRESFSTSFYWYKDGQKDVIHLGPVWDFDTCMGNDGEPSTVSYGQNHVLFRYLLAAPAFYERTMELLERYRPALEAMTEQVDALRTQIEASARMNYLRWDTLGKPNPKGGTDFAGTYEEAVQSLKAWLQGREECFRILPQKTAASTVSPDCQEMELRFRDDQEYESVMFALWSLDDGKDDLTWYQGERDADGTWYCNADLGDHNSAGQYYFNVYTDDQQTLLASGRNYVALARMPRYMVEAAFSADGTMLNVTLTDSTGELTAVRFAIWAMSDQAGTLQWLDARQEDSVWKLSVPAAEFPLERLVIHAYGQTPAGDAYLNDAMIG